MSSVRAGGFVTPRNPGRAGALRAIPSAPAGPAITPLQIDDENTEKQTKRNMGDRQICERTFITKHAADECITQLVKLYFIELTADVLLFCSKCRTEGRSPGRGKYNYRRRFAFAVGLLTVQQ